MISLNSPLKTPKNKKVEMKNKSLKIIIIDDNIAMTTLLSTLLELENFEVITINNIFEKNMKQTIKYHNPDAMIIDFHISGSDRLEIVKTIKSDPSLHKIKVIVASGTNMYKESMRVGADYFIQKPFMPSELLNNLKLLTTQDGD
ncbi:MAG: hypothetical protein CVU46_12140 [Chloroflexi bacterium HGW-Chloroflexi-8]|nr:MAG: hypothetical protein CVU46_12140 [Chloroflexi bacterium HGW-Chloroflexi-8]